MANILVLETDPVAAALLVDRLHVSGHAAMLLEEPVQAISKAAAGFYDLAVLDMEPGIIPGIEVVRQLRAQRETRSLPIVVLSKSGESADRLAALRAGADEYLTRPVDVEELLLRVDRLLGHGGSAAMMQGDLVNHPTWELVQYIQSAGKSGELVVHGPRGSGHLAVRDGRALAARWKRLQGSDALLAILDAKEGRFRLSAEVPEVPSAAAGFALEEVLMQSAWFADQLAKRRQHLPATGAALRLTDAEPPTVDAELSAVPIDSILQRLKEEPGLRLYDLIHSGDEAPPKVRLAVAWLVEQGALKTVTQATEVMSTGEISTSQILDLSIHNLLSAAAGAGFDVTSVSYLLLAEPAVQPLLRQALGESGASGLAALGELLELLERGEGGSADFTTDFGTLSLHIQSLAPAFKPQIETLVPQCAGVMIWLGLGTEPALIWSVVRRLEEAADAAAGTLVAENPATLEALMKLTGNNRRWRTSHQVPHSLIGILQLLHPIKA